MNNATISNMQLNKTLKKMVTDPKRTKLSTLHREWHFVEYGNDFVLYSVGFYAIIYLICLQSSSQLASGKGLQTLGQTIQDAYSLALDLGKDPE